MNLSWRGHGPVPDDDFERFEAKHITDSDSGCWLWLGALNKTGYGVFKLRGQKQTSAHRSAWLIYIGPIPRGLHVLHKCDNPGCVNPAHLFLGTHDENMADRQDKDRQAKGGAIASSKLTEDDVIAIRADGRMQKDIARDYGVHPSQISRVVRRERWRHV